MKSKKIVIIIAIVVILIVGVVLAYIKVIKPHTEAVNEYNAVVKVVKDKNKELDDKIDALNKLIDSGDKVIDESVVDLAKETTKKATANKLIVKDMPKKTDEIKKETEKLSTPPDYTDIIKELDEVYEAYDISIRQYKQLTNPSEEFVLQRLLKVDEIKAARAVTEDHDPNGQLHKPGGYTSAVYFESKNVKQKKVLGKNLIDKGTDAGGSIEVYASEEDANKRNSYLATFDGSFLASGSHRVIGTVVVRTSDYLSASKQKALEQKIIDEFIKLD